MVPNSITAGQAMTAEHAITAEQAIAPQQGRLDWLGVLCSFGCAVHCAAMPVLLATLPSFTNLRWLADPLFHQIVAVLCGVLVARAIVPGYRKHGNSRVVALAGVGLGMLFAAAFVLPDTCCSDAAELRKSSENYSAENYSAEIVQRSPNIVLVSRASAAGATKLGHFNELNEGGAVRREQVNCPHASTLSRPLLSAIELEGQLGATGAQALIRAQPYLSPIGGLFLIVAHIMNIRLRCCRRSPCQSKRG